MLSANETRSVAKWTQIHYRLVQLGPSQRVAMDTSGAVEELVILAFGSAATLQKIAAENQKRPTSLQSAMRTEWCILGGGVLLLEALYEP